MAVTLLDRPYAFITTGNALAAIIGGAPTDALVTATLPHDLLTGDYVYIKSPSERYNGFNYVEVFDANNFFIKPYPAADRIDALPLSNISATFYKVRRNADVSSWMCVHLPIVYLLYSDLWPTNTADTTRTISSVTDSNGYCALSLSGDIKATGSAAALEFVKVTGTLTDDLDTVWQIIAYTNDTTFTIDIPYSSANDTALTGASIQYYYNNYHVKVQVWGGLNNGHEWYGQKPYELLATLDLIPDEDSLVKFSIAEILKKQIEIENNLLLGTLPNNLDAFTMFFIKYAEVYDDSDGTTLTQTTPSYTSDLASFEGKAVNSKLAFKNIYSGAMSEYILNTENTGSFLTGFTRPTVFSGQYFDLSFLWDGITDILFKKELYKSGVLVTTEVSEHVDSFYTGVYRSEITAEDCDVYDRLDISAYKIDQAATPAPSTWTDSVGSWDTKSATVFAESVSSATNAVEAYTSLNVAVGEIVEISYTVIVTAGAVYSGLGLIINFVLRDNAGALCSTEMGTTFSTNTNGTFTNTNKLLCTAAATRLTIVLSEIAITSGSANVTVNPDDVYHKAFSSVSETKTIDFNCECLPAQATGFNLAWNNNLGGFDFWYFTAYTDHIIDITETDETEVNIFPEWPNSYGEFADTIKKQTFRKSRKQAVIRSQNLTLEQLQAIQYIKTSPLVQIVNSIYDRRTVLVDNESFVSYKEGQKEQYTITFTITYTDDVPSQSV